MSARELNGRPVPTATPGEVLAAIRVAAEIVESDAVMRAGIYPPSATEVAYAVMGVLGVVRVDQRGEPFSIDLDDDNPHGLRRFDSERLYPPSSLPLRGPGDEAMMRWYDNTRPGDGPDRSPIEHQR